MNRNNFIEHIAVIIKSMACVYGYKFPSAIIAQSILESNFGRSLLSEKYNNYFGLKCGSKWQGDSVNMATKEEYTAGTLTNIRDNFRAYSNIYEGVKGYFEFIQYSRYSNLKNATSPRDYLEKIKNDGYCTSSKYVENCMNLINQYSLTDFD